MAICANCGNTGFTTTSTGTVVFTGNNMPGSQFGFFSSYPTTCPGGCIYFTSNGYRCSTGSTFGSSGCNCGCGGGCGCGAGRCGCR